MVPNCTYRKIKGGSQEMKKGRFSVSEMAFIKRAVDNMSVDKIAGHLDRDPVSVHDWIEANVGFSKAQKKEVEVQQELKTRPYYKELSKQFTEEELEMFEFHFKKMWAQFKDDVFHTEEMQIIDTIKLEILMNRILRSQQQTIDSIIEVEGLLNIEKQLDKDTQDRDLIINYERQIAVLRSSQETLSRDYKDLQTRKATMLKDLKGTREQRIKAIEDSRETFASLITKLTIDPDFRTNVGIEMEKMRLAAEVERARLSQVITYEDKTADRPLLDDASVMGDL
jgi:hypothetical protein